MTSYKSNLKGKPCKNCRLGKHSDCKAWTCVCVPCTEGPDGGREKTLRLADEYNPYTGGSKFNRYGRAIIGQNPDDASSDDWD